MKLRDAQGLTLLIVEQSSARATLTGGRMVLMRSGEIVLEGDARDLDRRRHGIADPQWRAGAASQPEARSRSAACGPVMNAMNAAASAGSLLSAAIAAE